MASQNAFREDELVTRKVKINGQWESKTFPVVGGRLRLAHEGSQRLSVQTELVSWDGQYAVCKCAVTTEKGEFSSYATANAQRDVRLADSLIELAATRSVARSLRLAGYGVDMTGAEEVVDAEPESAATAEQKPQKIFPDETGNSKPETKPVADKPSNGDGPKATQAQVRAIRNIAFNRNRMSEQELADLITEFGVKDVPELSRQAASDVIQALQAQAA